MQNHTQDHLTEQEMAILNLLPTDFKVKNIAQQLNIGESTVRWHIQHIYQKLEANNRAQVVTIAIKKGLINP